MLLAAVSILDAAIARWFLTFLAPPGPPGPPPVPVTIPPAFVAYLLLVVAIVRDWRSEAVCIRSTSMAARADGREGAELADQRDAGVAFLRRRHFGDRAVAENRRASPSAGLAVIPPSTTSSIPVTYLDSSDARNSAALATSQASPMWPIGTCESRARHIASTSPLA